MLIVTALDTATVIYVATTFAIAVVIDVANAIAMYVATSMFTIIDNDITAIFSTSIIATPYYWYWNPTW